MEMIQIEIVHPKAVKLLRDLAALNLISIKKALRKDAISRENDKLSENETYPFKPEYLKFQNTIYILREKLDCVVSYEQGQYTISNNLLDITVWGSTRDYTEEAFAFAFYSLYENFAMEVDKKLSPKAIELKQNLLWLVLNVINNNEGQEN